MSEASLEALESEAYGTEGESEAAAESPEGEATSEAGWGEGYRDDARRRRQQQILMARQAQQRRQLPPPAPGRPPVAAPSQAVQTVRSQVRSLDLDTKVALDSLRGRLNEAQRLAYRNAWAAEASAAASQILDSFEITLEPHDWARALIRGAPTLLLAPGKPRKPGLEGVLYDPRVGGSAALAAIFVFGHFRNVSRGAAKIIIGRIPPGQLSVAGFAAAAGTPKLKGQAVDKQGNPITGTPITITWTSEDQNILKVDEDGTFTPLIPGPTRIFATGGGVTDHVDVTVTA
jgi:hypothetical protein